MKAAFCLLFFCFVAFAEHTVHVDEIYPNFGDTVRVSGPFTTDDLTTEILNVGRLTINSEDGLSISTDSSFQIDSASFIGSGETVTLQTNNEDGNISIVAAATFDTLADFISIGSDRTLNVNSLGSSEILAGNEFSLLAQSAVLAGESLSLSSVSGAVTFSGSNAMNVETPALSLSAKKDISFSSVSSVILDIQQAIEMRSNYATMDGETITIQAERNNVFLQGYTGISVNAPEFDVQVKGDATFLSANGNLLFENMTSVHVDASDDMVLDSADAIRVRAGDLSVSSAGTTFFLADSHSIYNMATEASFNARQSLGISAGQFVTETSNGDASLSSIGTFSSESADFTHMVASVDISFLSSGDVSISGSQGVELYSESRIFVGKVPGEATSGAGPIHFTAEDDLFFSAADFRVTTGSLSVSSVDVRFETSTGSNTNIQDWNVGGPTTFQVADQFAMKSTSLSVSSSTDLSLTGPSGVSLAVEGSQGALFSISTLSLEDTADNINVLANTFALTTSGDADFTASGSMDIISAKQDVSFDSSTILEVTSPSISQLIAWDSLYQTERDLSLSSETESISFSGAFAEFDVRGNFDIETDVVSISSFNVDLDADESASYSAASTSFEGSEYLIVNGNQVYDEYEVIQFTGSVAVSSPPSTDIDLNSSDLGIAGTITFVAYDLIFDIENTAGFSPFSFLVTTNAEEDISFVGDSLDVNGDDITITTEDRDRDTEFIFQAADQFTVAADTASFAFVDDSTITTLSTILSADNGIINNEETVVNAEREFAIVASNGITLRNYGLRAEADDTILFDTEEASFSSTNELFFRTDVLEFTANGDITMDQRNDMTFAGGNAAITTDEFALNSEDSIRMFGESSVVLSNEDFDLSFSEFLFFEADTNEIRGSQNVNFLADPILSVVSDEHRPFIIEANGGTASFIAEEIRYDSTDMFIINTGEAWTLSATTLYQETSAQDAGLLYFADESFLYDVNSDFLVAVSDPTLDGKDIQFASSDSAAFTAVDALTMTANGSKYDKNSNGPVGALFRSSGDTVNTPISFDSANDFSLEGWRALHLLAFNGKILHTSTVGDISLTSMEGGLFAEAGGKVSFLSDGTFAATLESYSIWTATDTVEVASEGIVTLETSGDIDLIADRGEIFIRHNGDNMLSFDAGDSIIGDGADEFVWTFGSSSFTGDSIELYGDTAFDIDADTSLSISAGTASYFISSLHNDIDFTTTNNEITIEEALELYAVDEIFWIAGGNNANNTFSAANDINAISEGSIDISGENDGTFTAAAGLSIAALNTVSLDAADTMTFGQDSLITLSAGGDTLDYGISISTDSTVSYTSLEDILISSDRFYSYSEGITVTSETFLINSRGGGVDGSDVSLDSEEGTFSLNGNTTQMTGGSALFQFSDSLSLSSVVELSISSASFIDIDSTGPVLMEVENWETSSESQAFSSGGDTQVEATESVSFTAQQTVSAVAHGDIFFGEDIQTNNVLFQTQGANSPITFATLSPITEFTISGGQSSGFVSASKTSISAENGVSFEAGTTATLTSADDFTATAAGDALLYGATISFTGDTTPGTGSQMIFTSTGSMQQNFVGAVSLTAGTEILLNPDKDLVIHAVRDEGPLLTNSTISITSETTLATMAGSFDFTSMLSTTIASDSYDWIFNGLWEEQDFGAHFMAGELLTIAGGVSTSFLADNIHFEGSSVSFNSTGAQYNVDLDGMSFRTTEAPTSIEMNLFANVTFSASELLSVRGTGSDPASGYVSFTSLGSSQADLYDFFNEPISTGIVAQNSSVDFNLSNGKFVYRAGTTVELRPGTNGETILRAAGADSNGIAIEVDTSELLISSGLNVNLRARNIIFNELSHARTTFGAAQFYDAADNYYYLDAFQADRLQLRALHDQSYTALGRNENGNGIEMRSDIPGNGFYFDVTKINFSSSSSLTVEGDSRVQFQVDNLDFVSLGGLAVTAEGSVNTPDTKALSFLYSGSMDFQAEDDFVVESSNQFIMDLETLFIESDDILFEAGSIDFNIRDFEIQANFESLIMGEQGVSVSAGGQVEFIGDEIFIEAGANAAYARGDVHLGPGPGNDGSYVLQPNFDINSDSTFLDSRVVDIPSNLAAIFPIRGSTLLCPAGVDTFFIQRDYYAPGFVELVYCENGNRNAVQLYGEGFTFTSF